MARKRKSRYHDDATQHERWMVSYADFITLLFAFFVVMYSISSVNEAKYHQLTESIGDAFVSLDKQQQANAGMAQAVQDAPAHSALSAEILKERQVLSAVSNAFEQALAPFVTQALVAVKKYDFWIELEMNSELLFASGEAEISTRALPILQQVAQVVSALPNTINVEGYSDNVPINTLKFPSNWDLASARATNVVKELTKQGINPERLAAVGYGEFHPVADNATEAGRFKNRRVVVLLMSQVFSRYGINDQERARLLHLESGSAVSSSAPATLTEQSNL